MNKTRNFKLFLFSGGIIFLGGIILLVGGRRRENLSVPGGQKVASQSGFKQTSGKITGTPQDERQKQEEETRQFIAQYGPCRNIPILMYHHVGDNPPAVGGWLYVGKNTFASQMDFLQQKGYSTVTLPEVMENLQTGKPLPAKPIVLTFDDGYRDVYENAYPVLRQKSLKATLFLPTQLLGGGDYLTWEQVREMMSSGLMTAGDHTLSHPSLPILNATRLKDEIISAKNILESNLGITVNTFAYPYGGFNGEAEKILREGNFVAAVTTRRGLACAKLPYELPRIRIGNAPLASYGL